METTKYKVDYKELIENAREQINDAIKRLNVHLTYDEQEEDRYKLCIGSDAKGQVGECVMDLNAQELYQIMYVLLFIAEKVRSKVRPSLSGEESYKTIKRIVYMIDKVEEDIRKLEQEINRIKAIEKTGYQGALRFITQNNEMIEITALIQSTFGKGYKHIFELIKLEYRRQIKGKKEQIDKLKAKIILQE